MSSAVDGSAERALWVCTAELPSGDGRKGVSSEHPGTSAIRTMTPIEPARSYHQRVCKRLKAT